MIVWSTHVLKIHQALVMHTENAFSLTFPDPVAKILRRMRYAPKLRLQDYLNEFMCVEMVEIIQVVAKPSFC